MTCPHCGATSEAGAANCFTCGQALAQTTIIRKGSLIASRYEILQTVGKGGMGVVYKSHDRVLNENVAVKLLRPEVAAEADMARRFRQEIKLARKVRHQNVCGIHEYGQDGDLRYIAMEFIEGVDLRRALQQRGALPTAEAFEVTLQVAEGLQAIHGAGIIHRDLKTSNIMLDARGKVRVMDFGVAKQHGAAATLGATAMGTILGTPEYMSPEQARGETVDFRSDIYALGIVIYEIFTGQVPFRGVTPVVTILKHQQQPPPLSGPRAANLPEPMLPVLAKALAKTADERYGSVAELIETVRAARDASGPLAAAPLTTDGSVALQPSPMPLSIPILAEPTPVPTAVPTDVCTAVGSMPTSEVGPDTDPRQEQEPLRALKQAFDHLEQVLGRRALAEFLTKEALRFKYLARSKVFERRGLPKRPLTRIGGRTTFVDVPRIWWPALASTVPVYLNPFADWRHLYLSGISLVHAMSIIYRGVLIERWARSAEQAAETDRCGWARGVRPGEVDRQGVAAGSRWRSRPLARADESSGRGLPPSPPSLLPPAECQSEETSMTRSSPSTHLPLFPSRPRYVNTWFESDQEPVLPLELGRHYLLWLNIGARAAEAEIGSHLFIEPDFGGHECVDLLVSFYSDDFEIEESARHVPLSLPRLGDSPPIRTRVAPRRAGACRLEIVISLARELYILQKVALEVESHANPIASGF